MIRMAGTISPLRLWAKAAGQPAWEPEATSVDRGAVIAQVHGVHGQYLFGFARRLGLTDDQADDAVQEVLARLLAALQGETIASPRGWAFRTIYRLAMDEHRLRRRLTLLASVLSRPASPEPGDDTTRIAVWAEVDHLPLRQRQVLYLRYRADLPYDEIATTLGITAGAARSHATQALARLRERLAGSIEEMH
jgi:RNA polymerase sigma-70 factor (ECF subfamily)